MLAALMTVKLVHIQDSVNLVSKSAKKPRRGLKAASSEREPSRVVCQGREFFLLDFAQTAFHVFLKFFSRFRTQTQDFLKFFFETALAQPAQQKGACFRIREPPLETAGGTPLISLIGMLSCPRTSSCFQGFLNLSQAHVANCVSRCLSGPAQNHPMGQTDSDVCANVELAPTSRAHLSTSDMAGLLSLIATLVAF